MQLHRDSRPEIEGMLIHIDSAFIVEACGARVLLSWLPRPRSSAAHLLPSRCGRQSPAYSALRRAADSGCLRLSGRTSGYRSRKANERLSSSTAWYRPASEMGRKWRRMRGKQTGAHPLSKHPGGRQGQAGHGQLWILGQIHLPCAPEIHPTTPHDTNASGHPPSIPRHASRVEYDGSSSLSCASVYSIQG